MDVKKDIQDIIDYAHNFAKLMLNESKEYYPFGASIQNNGKLVGVGYEDTGTDFPETHKILSELKSALNKDFVAGNLKSFGIAYDVKVNIDKSDKKSDAICIDVIHRNLDNIPKYYFTYSWTTGNKLIFGESFAIKR